MIGQWWRTLLDLIYLPADLCPLCQQPLEEGKRLCFSCWELNKRSLDNLGFCSRCGRLFERSLTGSICPRCQHGPPPYRWAVCVGPYRGSLKETVHNYKYRGQRQLAPLLAALLFATLQDRVATLDELELIVPVPVDPKRFRQRGFNHAELLATCLADLMRLETANPLIKERSTPTQTKLAASDRLNNQNEAVFVLPTAYLGGKRILLVDDVLTTGGTAVACTRALLGKGAKDVAVVVVAATVANRNGNRITV